MFFLIFDSLVVHQFGVGVEGYDWDFQVAEESFYEVCYDVGIFNFLDIVVIIFRYLFECFFLLIDVYTLSKDSLAL